MSFAMLQLALTAGAIATARLQDVCKAGRFIRECDDCERMKLDRKHEDDADVLWWHKEPRTILVYYSRDKPWHFRFEELCGNRR